MIYFFHIHHTLSAIQDQRSNAKSPSRPPPPSSTIKEAVFSPDEGNSSAKPDRPKPPSRPPAPSTCQNQEMKGQKFSAAQQEALASLFSKFESDKPLSEAELIEQMKSMYKEMINTNQDQSAANSDNVEKRDSKPNDEEAID